MLNRVVQIVHRGLIRPSDGARLLHGCASILEMQLLRELPRTTVVVRGLRKTNDLAQGHHSLVKSFGCYGDIVDASISPKNKGFGESSRLKLILSSAKVWALISVSFRRLCAVCTASIGGCTHA